MCHSILFAGPLPAVTGRATQGGVELGHVDATWLQTSSPQYFSTRQEVAPPSFYLAERSRFRQPSDLGMGHDHSGRHPRVSSRGVPTSCSRSEGEALATDRPEAATAAV